VKSVENKIQKAHISILMVCHGNICRSPMAEFVLKDMVKKAGLADRFEIASAATSTEEIGNPVHRGTREKLRQVGISVAGKTAVQLRKSDYDKYDYLIGMDEWNIRNMLRMLGGDPEGKIHKLLEFAGSRRDVADPWYTGDFETTYQDVVTGCKELMKMLKEKGVI
jgi:protein-tyrosine phosphatase